MKAKGVRLPRAARWLAAGAVAAAVVAGGAAAFVVGRLAGDVAAGTMTAAFFLGALLASLPIVAAGVLLARVAEAERQLHALVNVRPLAGGAPLVVGRFAADALFLETLARTLVEARPEVVVECGAGSSTLIAAGVLRELGRGLLISLDDHPAFAERTRVRLREAGLDRWARVVTAPLEPRAVDGRELPWYQGGFEAELPGAIDVLVVDGPRGLRRDARYPAVPLLRSHLADGCVVLMDDGARRDERRIARAWAAQLGGSLEYVRGGKGAWLIRASGTA